nr:saccharopine dehydrogenase-like oxidoreductase [Helicoverpa armigera]
MANKSIDIIVFGATGFTGKCAVKNLAILTKDKYCDMTWGIAGRSLNKLQSLKKELSDSGLAVENISIFESDIGDRQSLKKALLLARVVINCTGPNTTLSPPIVEACIECGTHYVDISAEMFHILSLYQRYNKAAEDKSTLIIPSCGFAAIPSETGMIYLERQFKGTLHTVECYVELLLPKRTYVPGRALIHNGTWTSLVYVLEYFKDYLTLWKELFPKPVEPVPEEMQKSFFHRHNGRCWFPYPGTDNDLVNMSQRYLHNKNQKKPVHFGAYTTVPLFFHWIVIAAIYLYYYLSYFKFFRNWLINCPRLFTLGYASKKGPTDRTRKDTKFEFVLNGKGWELDGKLESRPTKTMSVKVSGNDPGYDATSIAIIMSAITILRESSNMPKGGVIMPGAAFYRTDIVDRLMHEGYSYEILKEVEDL